MAAGTLETRRTWLHWLLWAIPALVALTVPGAGVIAAVLIVIAVLFRVADARRSVLRLWTDLGVFRALVIGVAAGAAMSFLASTVLNPLIERSFGASADLSVMESVKGDLPVYLQLLAIGLLVGGVGEELLFRGYIIGWGARLFGEDKSLLLLVLSTALFGFSHLYQGVAGMVLTGAIGLLLGLLYLACGRRLAPCMIAHMTIDAYGITALYLGQS